MGVCVYICACVCAHDFIYEVCVKQKGLET